jgi:hypothetical protein
MINKKLNTIYIISKGRPHCRTAQTLQSINYPGEWFIVCGSNDDTIEQYQKRWGKDKILIFDWHEEVKNSDLLDNFGVETMSSGAVPVRNATRKIARDRGELRHWQFDDDYVSFYLINKDLKKNHHITDGKEFEHELNKIATFAHNAKINNVGFCLGNESFPKVACKYAKRVFNAHNMPTDEKLFMTWRGRMNDDLINALDVHHSGKYVMSFYYLSLILMATQKESGGNTDIYQQSGTVRKTAYAVMIEPNATKLVIKFGRYHHAVDWKKITPKLLRETYAS